MMSPEIFHEINFVIGNDILSINGTDLVMRIIPLDYISYGHNSINNILCVFVY